MPVSNSLTVAGLEQVGDVTDPEYHLGKHTNGGQGSGLDFGEILPDTDVLSSLLLDGDIITGERTGNRTWNLVTVVLGDDRADLAVKVNAFVQAINQDSYQVVWTPEGCAPSVFTASRATFAVAKDFAKNGELVAEVVYSFETGPFARSLAPTSTGVSATGGPSSLQVDGMNSGSFLAGTLDTSIKYEGAGSCKLASGGTQVAARVITSTDLSAYAAISVRVRAGTNVKVNVSMTLTDNAAHSAKVSTGQSHLNTGWTLIQFAAGSFIGVDLAHVTRWQIVVSTGTGHFWVDDLRAFPAASVGNSTPEGTVLTVPAILGSARTPVALAVDRSGMDMSSLLLHSPPGGQDPDLTILAGLAFDAVVVPDANMNYDGTYSVIAFVGLSDTADRTITAAFTQTAPGGITEVMTLTVPVTGTQTMISLGEIALPLFTTPSENVGCALQIEIASDGTDTFTDVALCDTQGQTVLITDVLVDAKSFYVDEPVPTVGVGPVYASTTTDRTQAVSAIDRALISGGPMLFEPGDNRLLVASTSGAPNVTVTYTPAWLDEALV